MKSVYKVLLSGLLVWNLGSAKSQEFAIGNKVENFKLSYIINNKKTETNLYDIKAKLIILDFWSTGCKSCIRALPKMEELQNKFKNEIKIILINSQNKDSTDRFFSLHKKIKRPNLLMVTGDTALRKYFKHDGDPFNVWIDSSHIIRSANYGNFTTDSSITVLLSGKNSVAPIYKPSIYVESLIDTTFESSLKYYSYIVKKDSKLHIEGGKSPEGSIRITYSRMSIANLYEKAYEDPEAGIYFYNKPGRTIAEIKDIDPYTILTDKKKYLQWAQNNMYHYQLLVPEKEKPNLRNIIKDDLKKYFNLEAKIETRLLETIVLVQTGSMMKLKTKGGIMKDNFRPHDLRSTQYDSIRQIINRPFTILTERLRIILEYEFQKPFIDSVIYTGNIDIQIPGSLMDNLDIETLRNHLKQYGLDLRIKKTPMPVLVLRQKATE